MTVEFLSSVVCDFQISLIYCRRNISRDTVDRRLWLAVLSSLLYPETGRNIHIGKQGYVFYFTEFKQGRI